MRLQLITVFAITALACAVAALPAAAPARPATISHFTEGDNDFTLTTALDGHVTLLAKTLTGQILYNGPFTTPIERAEVPAALQRTLRLSQIRNVLGMEPGDEWDVLGPKAARVIQDQVWLEVDFQQDAIVLSLPKLSDPLNPLAAPARKLVEMLTPDPDRHWSAPDADLKVAIRDFRTARQKLLQTLAEDQSNLMKVSTVRQEAIFIRLGILN